MLHGTRQAWHRGREDRMPRVYFAFDLPDERVETLAECNGRHDQDVDHHVAWHDRPPNVARHICAGTDREHARQPRQRRDLGAGGTERSCRQVFFRRIRTVEEGADGAAPHSAERFILFRCSPVWAGPAQMRAKPVSQMPNERGVGRRHSDSANEADHHRPAHRPHDRSFALHGERRLRRSPRLRLSRWWR